MDSVVVLVSVQTRVCPGFESVVTTECVAVRVWWLVLSGECMYSRDQPYPAVHLLVAFLTHASHESSRPPPRAGTARARSAHDPDSGTHPCTRHRPFKSGARGRRGGGGRGRARGRRRGRALPGTARAEGREEENKPVGKARAAAAAAAAAAVWSSPARMMPAVPARGSGR